MAAAPRLGVLLNRFGGRDRRALRRLRAALAEAGQRVVVRESESARRCGDALEALLAEDVVAIAVAGGDGTVHHAITWLLNRAPGAPLPPLAILPTGTTNVTAHDIRADMSPAGELRGLLNRIVRDRMPSGLVTRRTMAVQLGDDIVPRYGLMGGAAGIYQGTVLIRRHLRRWGARGALGPIAGMARMIGPLLIGRNPIAPVAAAIAADTRPLADTRYVSILLSTLHSLSPGISPFWGSGPGALRLTLVREQPRHFARAVWPALRGRRSTVATPENGYISLNADSLELRMSGGFVLDGEILELREDQPARVTTGPELLFLRS
ncbi:MAG: diacylglycerol kinase family protein [Reyranellaceae bacterium]